MAFHVGKGRGAGQGIEDIPAGDASGMASEGLARRAGRRPVRHDEAQHIEHGTTCGQCSLYAASDGRFRSAFGDSGHAPCMLLWEALAETWEDGQWGSVPMFPPETPCPMADVLDGRKRVLVMDDPHDLDAEPLRLRIDGDADALVVVNRAHPFHSGSSFPGSGCD